MSDQFERTDYSEKYCVKITVRENDFVRFDFVNMAFTIAKRGADPYVKVSGLRNPLFEYAKFLVSLADDSLVQSQSRRLSLRQVLEIGAIIKHYQDHRQLPETRFWRFVRKSFPEYAALYNK